MTYITYPQAEELLIAYPQLKSYLDILQIELERLYYQSGSADISSEDILYSLAIGNRVMSDMPHAMPTPGDKMTNIILAKDSITREELQRRIAEILALGEVVEKIARALNCLTIQERKIVEMKYFQGMTWKEMLSMLNLVGDRQTRQIRRDAIEKMLPLLRITLEQFEFCVGRVSRADKKQAHN